jgi:hypothetical protein
MGSRDGARLMPAQRTELRRLERALAYSAARSDIECCCTRAAADRWYDPNSAGNEERESVDIAIRYLDLRGLIERSPEGWVRVREDDAA